MKFSQETLMAYADGELDAQTRRAIEAAMATDTKIAERIERHRALQSGLQAAFCSVLDEQIPGRLIEAAKSSPAGAGAVVDLTTVRAGKVEAARRRWSWSEWTSIAASLLIGVMAGRFALPDPESTASSLLVTNQSRIVAAGALAGALSEQAGGAAPEGSAIDIGPSFRAKSGEYCRTFTTRQETALAGLACREADAWRVQALAQSEQATPGNDYRMAGTPLPPPILQAVAEAIEGEALDADQETAARRHGWRK